MGTKNNIENHFNEIAFTYDNYKRKNSYYYNSLKNLIVSLIISKNYRSVLDIGCGTGEILDFLNPEFGIGIDISKNMVSIARMKYPEYEFIASDFNKVELDMKFDIIIVIDVIEHLGDIKKAFLKIRNFAEKGTKIIISSPSYHWRLPMFVGEKLNMKMPEGSHKWIPPKTLEKTIESSKLRIDRKGYKLLIPKRVPFLSNIINSKFIHIPILRNLGIIYFFLCTPE